MIGRFRQWRDHVEAEGGESNQASGIFPWTMVSLFVAVLLAVCTLIPQLDRQIGLDFVPAALWYLPLPSLAAVAGLLRRASAERARRWVAHLGNFLVELYPAMLIASSQMTGAALFSAFYLLVTLFHAQLFRVSPRFPFWLACFLAQGAISLAWNHDDAHIAVWSVLMPAALTSALIVGNSKLREDKRRAELLQTRTALAASLLEVEAKRGEALEDRMKELLGIAHDIKSPLTAASLELSALEREVVRTGREDLVPQIAAVRLSVARLKDLFAATRERASERQLTVERVSLNATAAVVLQRARRAYPGKVFDLSLPADATVATVGGPGTLERIIENIVINACEGDGKEAGRRIQMTATAEMDQMIIAVTDDGPGFPPGILAAHIEGHRTTKASGSGLGLFTVERLVRACGGELVRANKEGRGACVTVKLPRP